MRKTFILFFLCFVLFACNKEEVQLQEPTLISYDNVEEELWDYFFSFELEAASRGINYDLNALQIEGTIVELNQGSVAGICSYNSHAPNRIQIDAAFWNRASNLLKEMIVFHELGHCVIGRGHYEVAYSDGTCASVMGSGVGSCQDNYTNISRADYLDELFLHQVNLL